MQGPPGTAESLLELGRSYQPATVFLAAAELELFDTLAGKDLSAEQVARKLRCAVRGIRMLMDALVALRLLRKRAHQYSLPPGAARFLASDGTQSILAIAQHQANCLRNWAQLAKVVKTGQPAEKQPSIRGPQKDLAAFISAMHNVSVPNAKRVIQALRPFRFTHLLDLGGASGTWTVAFLKAQRDFTATIFDLPPSSRWRAAGWLRWD
jgi:hypothetical protein